MVIVCVRLGKRRGDNQTHHRPMLRTVDSVADKHFGLSQNIIHCRFQQVNPSVPKEGELTGIDDGRYVVENTDQFIVAEFDACSFEFIREYSWSRGSVKGGHLAVWVGGPLSIADYYRFSSRMIPTFHMYSTSKLFIDQSDSLYSSFYWLYVQLSIEGPDTGGS